VNGETVLDIAGGYQDKEKTIPYDVTTMNLVFSSGKIPETIGIALLVDKGLMELDTPIKEYWPEFAQKRKGEITMGDILSHRSGAMDSFEKTPDAATLQDDHKRDEFLASQKFLFPRGTVGYRGASSGKEEVLYASIHLLFYHGVLTCHLVVVLIYQHFIRMLLSVGWTL